MIYHVAIIGGGLAGLSLSIDLRKRGYDVVVIEKGNYPRQKVCGEYISCESHTYLQSICPALKKLQLPFINHFKLSSTGNTIFRTKLDLGGFGISRYLLDSKLVEIAKKKGVHVLDDCRVLDVKFDGTLFFIDSSREKIESEAKVEPLWLKNSKRHILKKTKCM